MRRTKSARFYKEPSDAEIRYTMYMLDFEGDYSNDLIRDIANACSYFMEGVPVKECLLPLKDTVPEIKNPKKESDRKKYEEYLSYNEKVQSFISNLDFSKFPGNSPLQKAANVLYSISDPKKDKAEKPNKKPKQNPQAEKSPLELMIEMNIDKNSSSKSEDDQKSEENGDGNNGDAQNDNQGSESDSQQNDSSGGSATGGESNGENKPSEESPLVEVRCDYIESAEDAGSSKARAEKVSDVVAKFESLREGNQYRLLFPNLSSSNIRLFELSDEDSKLLDSLALLKDDKDIESHATPTKNELVQMTEFTQVGNMANMSQMMLPNFIPKFATRNLIVKKRIERKKQTLILMIDDSGSMNSVSKKVWVKALIWNRVLAVLNKKAELYILTFERNADIYGTHYLSTPEQAEKFMKSDWFPRFSGGGTDIQNAMEEVMKCLDEKRLGCCHITDLENPQLVIINDGQDHIDPTFVPKIVTHSFILGQDNNNLKTVVTNSGGTYKRFL